MSSSCTNASTLTGSAPVRRRSAGMVLTGAAAVLALAGATLCLSTLPALASATTCSPGSQVNPMMAATPTGASEGFTVRSFGDMTLGNSETEGSLAVGGVLTLSGQNDYPLLHQSAGYSNYSLPTIDGDPTRLLVSSGPARGASCRSRTRARACGRLCRAI